MTDQELILARAWAMLSDVERDAISGAFVGPPGTYVGRAKLNKLAEDWIEELRVAKGVNPRTGKKPSRLRKLKP